MNEVRGRTFVRAAAILALAGWLSTAAAQFETIGTLTATLGGEARTWFAVAYEDDGEVDGTASLTSLSVGPTTMYSLHLQGHVEPTFVIEGTLAIDATFLSPLDDCPCVIGTSEVYYFTTSSMFGDVYQSITAELVVESFEMIDDGVAAVRGSFSALLGFVESPTSGEEPDPERSLELAGQFVIDRMLVESE